MKVTVGKTGSWERPKDEEKVLGLALTEEAAKQNPEGWQQIVKLLEFNKIQSLTDPETGLKTYSASGRATIQKLRLKDDKLFPKAKCSFSMEAKESFDDIGLPDIEVKKLDIRE